MAGVHGIRESVQVPPREAYCQSTAPLRLVPKGETEFHLCRGSLIVDQLPDGFNDTLKTLGVTQPSVKKNIITHCRRELSQAAWRHLLDAEFLHAYRYGIVIKCSDGVTRRIYPRFFTYTADYPEK